MSVQIIIKIDRMLTIKKIAIFGLFLFCISGAWGESFIVKDIQVQGLQRISKGTFLSYLPVKKGDRVDASVTIPIIKALYKTGFFSDIKLFRSDNTLVIKVTERPTISELNISGNRKIEKKKLLEVLKQAKIQEGRVFDDSTLAEVRQALLQEYYNLGRYNVQVDTKVVKKPRNTVAIKIEIAEGPVAKIKSIKIIGNKHFSERELLSNFSLSTSSFWTIFTSADQYSKEKLDADLESLRSFYLDRGYLQFRVDSTQVSITPDKQHVYIVIHVIEGPVYKISGFELSGNLLGQREKILKLIDIKKGDIFSRRKIVDINSKITVFLGDQGYAFPNISPQPKLDEKQHTVFVNFVIDPGQKVYIRRVSFVGNSKTAEHVLRREMRQMEGGLFSLSKIKESQRRVANLGYLTGVQPQLKKVEGHPDQADLQYNVKEAPSAAASLQVGYSDAEGFLYGASLNERNFLGSGKSVGINFNNSKAARTYSFNYYDPYFTKDNVSLGINAYTQYTTPGKTNIATYDTDVIGASATYGIPLSDYSRLNFGYGYEYTYLKLPDDADPSYREFADKHGHYFDDFNFTTGWQYSNYDKYPFPTKGISSYLSGKVTAPLTDNSLEYYKINYEATMYHPLSKYFILNLHGFAGYGNGYGKYDNLPFFKNYFAGGIDSVRGYLANSLGPKTKGGDALGGNISVNASAGIVFPNPFGKSVRTTAFIDGGNVYQNNFRHDHPRYSAGVQLVWNTPVAPLVFSLAKAINPSKDDTPIPFQFAISAVF